MSTRLLKTSQEILSAYQSARPNTTLELIALYSSQTNSLIQDPFLIGVPVRDHLMEGWGVFDTLNSYNSVPYQMNSHIDRLFQSASNSKMVLSFTKEEMQSSLIQILRSFPNKRIRLFISGSNSYYILVYNDVSQAKPVKIKEFTVSVPIKPVFLSVIKTTNYLVNTLCVLEAREKGGYMGIFLDDDGNIAESAIANIAIVNSGRFLMPFAKNILEGTTAKRVLQYCEELVKEGVLQFAGRDDIKLDMVYTSEEVMMLGGDSVIAIEEVNGVNFGKTPGNVTEKIFRFLESDKASGFSDL